MRVLLCDDEPSIRMLFRSAVERLGAEVVEAGDGDECLRVALAARPDMVILDVVMPRRDGWSTLPLLRELCPEATVVLTSANAPDELIEQGLLRGAHECIDKLALLPMIPALLERTAVLV